LQYIVYQIKRQLKHRLLEDDANGNAKVSHLTKNLWRFIEYARKQLFPDICLQNAFLFISINEVVNRKFWVQPN